jgi:hypothetical protein
MRRLPLFVGGGKEAGDPGCKFSQLFKRNHSQALLFRKGYLSTIYPVFLMKQTSKTSARWVKRPDRAYALREADGAADEVNTPPIRSAINYATALHEIGNIRGRHQNSRPRHGGLAAIPAETTKEQP